MNTQRWGAPSNGTSGAENSPTNLSDNMSDNSDDKSEKCDDICRDFLRNVCKRGKRCKYRHPAPPEARELGKHTEYTFCHDFQNSGCRRANCKFIHCSREEEEYYKQTGQLPVRLQQAAALGIGVIPNEIPLLKGEVPICKDYLKGECKRASRCKYRHLSGTQYEYEVRTSDGTTPRQVCTPNNTTTTTTNNNNNNQYEPTSYNEDTFDVYNNYDRPPPVIPAKRKKLDFEDVNLNHISTFHVPADAYRVPPPPALRVATPDFRLLEEENMMLRRKVEELKKQVSDLAATNEVLLEQNARYRSNKGNVTTTTSMSILTGSQLAMVTPTITTTMVTPTLGRPMVAAVPQGLLNPLTTTLAPMTSSLNPMTTTLATLNPMSTTLNPMTNAMNSMNPQISTLPQINLGANSELVVSQGALQGTLQGTLQQRMATELSQPNNMTAPPINTPVTMNATNIVPVSIGLETLAPHGGIASVSLAQSSMQPTVSLSQSSLAQNLMSMPSTPMVSYPIMSHAALPTNSLNSLTSLNTINTSLG